MVKSRGESKRPARAEVQEELSREFRHLRTLVREVGENFILRQEGEIETALGNLEALSAARLRSLAPDLLQELRKLKVKPAKGRFKDVKELNRLIAELAELVISAPVKKKRPGKG